MTGRILQFDIESQNQSGQTSSTWLWNCYTAYRRHTRSLRSSIKRAPVLLQNQFTGKQIEDHPAGYPQFSSLIASHHTFSISRRFTKARARILLQKQDRVILLEKELEELDENEQRPLFLGSIRRDQNQERRALLQKLDEALADYDNLLARNATVIQYASPTKRQTSSLINWSKSNGSICPKETSYLHEQDLCTTGKPDDDGMRTIESLVEQTFIWIAKGFKQLPASKVSRNKNVFIFTGPRLRVLTRLLISWLMVCLLVLPVVMVHAVNSATLQIVCVALSSTIFVLILSGVMNARVVDVFVAGPTYAALLVVFLSGGKNVN